MEEQKPKITTHTLDTAQYRVFFTSEIFNIMQFFHTYFFGRNFLVDQLFFCLFTNFLYLQYKVLDHPQSFYWSLGKLLHFDVNPRELSKYCVFPQGPN